MSIGEIVAGFVVGSAVGLTGVGGGALMTPILIVMFGIHPSTAIGTDLLFAAATKSVGTLVHGLNHTVEWPIVLRLAAGSLPGAAAALFVLGRLGVDGAAANAISADLLAAAVLIAALSLMVKPWLATRLSGGPRGVRTARRKTVLTVLLGVVLGVIVSLTSVGAGALGTVALILLYPDLPMARIVGSDLAHAVPLTLLAGIGHWTLGTVSGAVLAPLLIGSVPGIVLGSIATRLVPERLLRGGLALILAASAIRLLLR